MEYKVNRYQLLPASLLMIAGLLIFVFFAGNKAIDIQLHSTYYVIPYIHFVYYNLVGYGLYGLIYWFYRNSKRRFLWRLSMIHLTLSVIGALIFFIMLAITGEFVSKGSWLGLDMEAKLFVCHRHAYRPGMWGAWPSFIFNKSGCCHRFFPWTKNQ